MSAWAIATMARLAPRRGAIRWCMELKSLFFVRAAPQAASTRASLSQRLLRRVSRSIRQGLGSQGWRPQGLGRKGLSGSGTVEFPGRRDRVPTPEHQEPAPGTCSRWPVAALVRSWQDAPQPSYTAAPIRKLMAEGALLSDLFEIPTSLLQAEFPGFGLALALDAKGWSRR